MIRVRFLWLILIWLPSYGQNTVPEIYLNHVYIVLDSVTYQHLFDSSVLTQKLVYTLQYSTQTNQSSYTGKYLAGKNGYLEFFTTASHSRLPEGSIGLGFMTFKSNDINKVKQYWEHTIKDSISLKTVQTMDNGKTRPWYYGLELYKTDSNGSIKVWLMENTPEDLLSAGFSEQEIANNKISWQGYVQRQSKIILKRPFNRILSVQIFINKKEFEYLRETLPGLGLKQGKNAFYNKNIKVKYTISSSPSRLIEVETELSTSFTKTEIKIGNSIVVQINGTKAIWNFNK